MPTESALRRFKEILDNGRLFDRQKVLIKWIIDEYERRGGTGGDLIRQDEQAIQRIHEVVTNFLYNHKWESCDYHINLPFLAVCDCKTNGKIIIHLVLTITVEQQEKLRLPLNMLITRTKSWTEGVSIND